MALTKLMGQNFRVFVGSSPIVEETSCQVTIQGNQEDASTKDVVGSYAQQSTTSKQWSVQVDSQDAALATLRALITSFNSDTKQSVAFDQASGDNNQTAQNADFARSGYAILNDLSIVMNNRQPVTYTAQFQGSGALA
jgi:hypothetical protein